MTTGRINQVAALIVQAQSRGYLPEEDTVASTPFRHQRNAEKTKEFTRQTTLSEQR
jgi:hypothetical protein